MQFLKDFARNIAILVVLAIVLYLAFPEQMAGVVEVWGAILGPIGLLVIVVFALPRKRRN